MLSAQTLSEGNKKEFSTVVNTAYTGAKLIQEHAKTFIRKLKRENGTHKSHDHPFWKGSHFFQELSDSGEE